MTRRILIGCVVALVAVYSGIYAALSRHGHYVSFVTVRVWQPQGVVYSVTMDGFGFTVELNTLGRLYIPAIWLDRLLWHRDRGLV